MRTYKGIKSPMHPLYMLVIFDIAAFLLLFIRRNPFDVNAVVIGSSLIVATLVVHMLTVRLNLGDTYIFLIVAMLFSMGELMLYRLDAGLGVKQAGWFGISLVVYFLSFFILRFTNFWKKLLFVLPVLSVAVFILTMIFGTYVNGSRNWIFIKGFSIQTSEINKLIFIFFLACFYNRRDELMAKYSKWRVTLAFMAVSYLMIGLMMVQREWGTPLVLMLVFAIILYILENNPLIFLFNTFAVIAAGAAGAVFIEHIRTRVEAWINPWADIAGKGYQIAQSLFAIGSGDFLGTGIGLGRPDLIPYVKTDFIFSAICEEMGFFGGTAVILLFLLLSYRGFKIALGCGDIFGKTLALGITLMFAFQSFVIIGGVIKLFLLTGITLPFISYGGSSMVVNFAALGVLQRISAANSRNLQDETWKNPGTTSDMGWTGGGKA